MAKAKAAGVYKAGKRSIDRARIAELKGQGLGATEIAKRLGIGRASVYGVLEGGAKRRGSATSSIDAEARPRHWSAGAPPRRG
jgi:DNA invertase Pin-like site-specific DNA recombinase